MNRRTFLKSGAVAAVLPWPRAFATSDWRARLDPDAFKYTITARALSA